MAQSFSFLTVLLDCAAISTNPGVFCVEEVLKPRLLQLVLRTVYKTPELEYLHYTLQIVNHALKVHKLRRTLCTEDLRLPSEINDHDGGNALYFHNFLRSTVEK